MDAAAEPPTPERAREAPARVALLGCGSIGGSVHLPLLARMTGAEVVVVADPDARALARARRIAQVDATDRPEEAIGRPDVDAVIVCAPSASHAELAVAALSAGKHLYLEKPVATTVADGRRVVAAAPAEIVAAVGFNCRFHPGLLRLRSLLESGALGNVEAVAGRLDEPMPAHRTAAWRRRRRTGGGVLLDLASHHVDLLRWLLGEELEVVDAAVRSRSTEGDVARLRLRSERGVRCESTFSYRSGRSDLLELSGERGTIRFDRYAGRLELSPLGARRSRPGRLLAGRLRALRPRPDPSHERALDAFVGRIRGTAAALPSLEDGLRSLEVVVGAAAAAGR